MESCLPKPSGVFLSFILGSVNVSILDLEDKFRYKVEYEVFKVFICFIIFITSAFNMVTNFRVGDLVHRFLLVWYYFTVTIKESILRVNGSQIRGWWRAQHFICTLLSGILLMWPHGESFQSFRRQSMAFYLYGSFV